MLCDEISVNYLKFKSSSSSILKFVSSTMNVTEENTYYDDAWTIQEFEKCGIGHLPFCD